MSNVPNEYSFVPTTQTSESIELDEHGPSTGRLLLMLGVGGSVFWAALAFLAVRILS